MMPRSTAPPSLALNRIHYGDCLDLVSPVPAASVHLAFAAPPFNIGYAYDTYDDRRTADGHTRYFPRVCGTFKERSGWHGCQMPKQLLGRIIRASSHEGETVLDPFAGSGTTLAVAKKLRRRFLGCELSETIRGADPRAAGEHPPRPAARWRTRAAQEGAGHGPGPTAEEGGGGTGCKPSRRQPGDLLMACPRPALLRLARWCGVPDTRPLFSGARPMKYGLNLLLWTDRMHDGLVPVVEKVKALGYDGVEMPIFELNEPLHAQWGKRLDDLGLERTAVTVRNAGDNPISPSAPVWAAAVDAMKKTIDCCRAAGVKTLCGPTHSAIGDQRIHRHRADRR